MECCHPPTPKYINNPSEKPEVPGGGETEIFWESQGNDVSTPSTPRGGVALDPFFKIPVYFCPYLDLVFVKCDTFILFYIH